jgi:hypothetical protein
VVPVVGAALWAQLGYKFPFLFGTVFIIISLFLTQKIDISKQRVAGAPMPITLEHEAEREMAADGPVLDVDSAFPVTPEAVDAEDELAAEQTLKDRKMEG